MDIIMTWTGSAESLSDMLRKTVLHDELIKALVSCEALLRVAPQINTNNHGLTETMTTDRAHTLAVDALQRAGVKVRFA